jgi:hypothetical protein
MPTPAEARQGEIGDRVEACIGRVADCTGGNLGMDENGLPEAGRGCEEIFVYRIVEE